MSRLASSISCGISPASSFAAGDTVGFKVVVKDLVALAPVSGAQVFTVVQDAGGGMATTIQGFTDATGTAVLKWKTARRQAAGAYTGRVSDVLKSGYQFRGDLGVTSVTFTVQ